MGAFADGYRRRVAGSFTLGLLFAAFLWVGASPARAVIVPATTIDGPNAEIISLDGVAMAPDGTGGLEFHVYLTAPSGSGGPLTAVDEPFSITANC